EILKIHTKNMNLEEDVDIELVSTLSEGASGADLKAICTEAGMFAIREERPIVVMNDFLDAVDKIIGMERDEEIRKETGVMYG
ncbi:MAG: proteasome-activating nucleotidase, partial [Methanobacterium sp.]|nr:proteasome-activating nucleotidase [Methanobacterium sp.]